MHNGAVVIAGYGAISAVGKGAAALRDALQSNRSGLRPDGRFSGPRFQTSIVAPAPIDPCADDPAFELARTALEEAQLMAHATLKTIPGPRVGLVLSTTKANLAALELCSAGRVCSEAAKRHLQAELLAEDLAALSGAQGPIQTVSNACVSGLIAIMQGAKLIHRGAADAVLVVGVDHLSAFVVGGFSALKALDPEGCRPFDAQRRGLSPGEAGAAIVLVRADSAPQKAVSIRGWGASNDANHMTGPSRDGAGLAQAIRTALKTSDLDRDQIDYVNAHGTGTPYNDAMETAALRTVFENRIPPVSGLKGMLGHTLGAAGVIESVACVLAMEAQMLPGTPRLQQIAEQFAATLLQAPRPATRLNHVLKLNTGFGGVNGALILGYE